MAVEHQWIIDLLPYQEPFLFVDHIEEVNDNYIRGNYTFSEKLPFYDGHFVNNPVTPGVILTECMAQIGLVCMGIYLLKDKLSDNMKIGMTSAQSDYYIPVLPNEKLTVESNREFFRFNKLKCQCKLYNSEGKLVAKSVIAGMLKA